MLEQLPNQAKCEDRARTILPTSFSPVASNIWLICEDSSGTPAATPSVPLPEILGAAGRQLTTHKVPTSGCSVAAPTISRGQGFQAVNVGGLAVVQPPLVP